MRKKEILARCLTYMFPQSFLLKLRSLFINEITVLAYHRISDVQDEDEYEFDMELISASCAQFDEQIKYIKQNYNPISIEEFVAFTEGKFELPKRSVLITFDDGFIDNYENAYPILKRHNVPAVIYISTEYINTDDTIWFDKLVFLIKSINDMTLNIDDLGKEYVLSENNRGTVATKICSDLKTVPNKSRIKILNELNEKYGQELKSKSTLKSRMMSWDNVREMDESCISFGSHTVSHPILSQLTDVELSEELEESKRDIEKNLNHVVDTISYPVGDSNAFNDRVLNATKKAGYKVGFSYISGKERLPIENVFDIKRLHVERYNSYHFFRSMLNLPGFFKD